MNLKKFFFFCFFILIIKKKKKKTINQMKNNLQRILKILKNRRKLNVRGKNKKTIYAGVRNDSRRQRY